MASQHDVDRAQCTAGKTGVLRAGRGPTRPRRAGALRCALAAGLVLALGAICAPAQDIYLEPSDDFLYEYRNTLPDELVTHTATTEEVGGDVFAKSIGPGDQFPDDIVLYDEKNEKHDIKSFFKPDRPLVLVLGLIAAPRVMNDLADFQKSIGKVNTNAEIILVNVAQFGSSLQPGSQVGNTGRTLKFVAGEYGLDLPFYWVDNNIYTADGFTNRLRVRDLPTYLVIDGNGKVVRVFGSSHKDWSAGDLAMTD